MVNQIRLAKISNDFSVTLGNSIPKNAWVTVTAQTPVSVATTQAILIIRLNDDAFWGYFYTPNSNAPSQISVPANSVYTLFTKPDNYTGANLAVAFESTSFSQPVLMINGSDNMYQNNAPTYLNYYNLDVRPYFSQ